MTNDPHTGLMLAVQRAGGQQQLADICECTRQNINQAVATRRGLPAKYVDKVEAVLKIPRDILRPDIFAPTKGQAE